MCKFIDCKHDRRCSTGESEWVWEEVGKILTAIVRSYSLVVIDAEGVKSSRDVHVPQHCAPASPANTITSPSTFTFFEQYKLLSKYCYFKQKPFFFILIEVVHSTRYNDTRLGKYNKGVILFYRKKGNKHITK